MKNEETSVDPRNKERGRRSKAQEGSSVRSARAMDFLGELSPKEPKLEQPVTHVPAKDQFNLQHCV